MEASAALEGKMDYEAALFSGRPLPPHFGLLKMGLQPFAEAIALEQMPSRGGHAGQRTKKLFRCFTPSDLAYVALWTMVTEVQSERSVASTSVLLGTVAKDHFEYMRFLEQNPKLLKTVESGLKTKHAGHRHTVILRAKRKYDIPDVAWDHEDLKAFGLRLIHLLIESTGQFEISFSQDSVGKMKKLKTVEPSQETRRYMERSNKRCVLVSAKYLPCCIPPKPWTKPRGCGFYSGVGAHNLKLVKTRHDKVIDLMSLCDWNKIFKGLNALQETAWKINKPVLEVVDEVWDHTNGLGIMDKVEAIVFPPKPWSTDEEWKFYKKDHPEAYLKWCRETTEAHDLEATTGAHAKFAAQAIGRARQFKDEEKFYFVWTCDYRGRVYPIQLYLTPQGDDLCKGLLQFADGVALGEDGADWLAIHGANCFGEDKVSLADRIRWVTDHAEEIDDSATNPLDGERFWLQADDPWMFLAFCFEWAQLRDHCAGGNPESTFVSHLPIGVDGSCNGLQHLSAMVRDEEGGAAVNLVPQPRPNDIYSQVCRGLIDLVSLDLDSKFEQIIKDKEGEEKCRIHHGQMALLWQGKIDRKLVKPGVMTTPYGSTSYGKRLQIMERLKKLGGDYLAIDKKQQWQPALYLSKKLEQVIDQAVSAASLVMEFFKKIAKLFSQAGLNVITWVSPSGFLSVQHYVQSETVKVYTLWGKQKIRVSYYKDTDVADGSKASAGISPNVVHSFDAAHLINSVCAAKDQGVNDFAMVHDSYGCHAGHMSILSDVLRQEFVKIYSGNVLEDLAAQLKAQLPEEQQAEFPAVPPMGNLDLSGVLKSSYFFA
jgi:DNA-directed RNA polymerase